MPDWINAKLDTPIKRLGSLVAAAGSALTAIGIVQIIFDAASIGEAIRAFGDSAAWLFRDSSYASFETIAFGVPLAVLGLAFSFFYDAGVGKVIGWILHGSSHPRERRA